MELHFTHALVLTPFESSLVPLQWDAVAAQMLAKSAIQFTDEQQIIILREDESEYNAEDILKHLI